jgi:protein-tyrosine-phosphatase
LTLAAPTFTFDGLQCGRERAVMPRRIVFVCTGNSCRSPLAEVLARARYADLPLIFASAGTGAVAGQPASGEARAVARERGLDLDAHRSAPVDAVAVVEADWLIGLTRVHAALLRQQVSAAWPGRIGLLGAPGRDWRRDGPPGGTRDAADPDIADPDIADPDIADPDIADPWRQDLEAYRRTADRIDRRLASWSEVFSELCSRKD